MNLDYLYCEDDVKYPLRKYLLRACYKKLFEQHATEQKLNSNDLVLATSDIHQNLILLNKGGGKFTEAIDLPGGTSITEGIVLADFNNDSTLDLVIANDRNGEDKILLNKLSFDPSLSFGAALPLPGGGHKMAFLIIIRTGSLILSWGTTIDPTRFS